MELLQLQYFCDTAETENFSKTAKKHLVPTSSVSQSIKRLEKELGCELFDHGGNKITLNNDGKQFYADASQALLLLDQAKERILEQSEELQGDVHLICMSNRKIVTDALEVFVQQHPKVNFIIHHNLEAEQSFDVLISNHCPYEYSKKLLLVDEEICVAVHRDHPLAKRNDPEITDLEKERFITMPPGSNLYGITTNLCTGAGFSPNIAIQTDDPFYIRKYVEMGLGIAFVPQKSWEGLFEKNVVLKSVGNIRRKTYAYLSTRLRPKRAVERFLQVLREQAEKS